MKVSVIIPIFDESDVIQSCLSSLEKQTLKDFEVIVVDDGSTDNSLKIAQSYEPQIKVVSQVNKGLPSARNTGIMWATGDFVLPLDADDILLPDCVEKILEVIKQNPNADIIAPSFKCFGKGEDTIILKENIILKDFETGNYLPYFCAIKREKLLEIGGYSPKMIWGWEDLHLWINLLSRGAIVKTIPKVLVLYRTKEKSMWTDSKDHAEELQAQINKDFPTIF